MTRATTAGQRRSLQGFTSVLLFLMPVVASLGSVVSIGGFAAARPLAAVLVVVTFLPLLVKVLELLLTPGWGRVVGVVVTSP